MPELGEYREKLGYNYVTKKNQKIDNPFLKKLSDGKLSDDPGQCKSVLIVHDKLFKKQSIQKGYWIPYVSMIKRAWYDKAEDIKKKTGINNAELLKKLDHRFSIIEIDRSKWIQYTMARGHHYHCCEGKKVKQRFQDASGKWHEVGERVEGEGKYEKSIKKVLMKLGLLSQQQQPQQPQQQPRFENLFTQQSTNQPSSGTVASTATKVCNKCGQPFVWKTLDNGKFLPYHINSPNGQCPQYVKK